MEIKRIRVVCNYPKKQNMLPILYQTVLEKHLNPKENLTVELLILMLQSFRQVKLSTLASVFPQPISYESRLRNLQRFLVLPQWNVKLLWFPIVKCWLKQEYWGYKLNREQKRRRKKLKLALRGKLLVVIDRTKMENKEFNGGKFSVGKTRSASLLGVNEQKRQ